MEEKKDGMGEVKGKDKERWRTNEEEEQRKKQTKNNEEEEDAEKHTFRTMTFFFVFMEFCFFTRSDR